MNPSSKTDIVRDAGIYTSTSVLTQLITLLAAILTRRFLGPLQMGVWSILQVVQIYSAYTLLGITHATSREIPFYRGKGDEARVNEIKNLVFSFSIVTGCFVATGLVAYAFLFRGNLRVEVFYGLIFMAALILLERFNNVVISLLRAFKEFRLASKQMVLSAIVNAALVAFLAYHYEIYGFLWAMCLSLIFNIAYILYHHRFSFRWSLHLKPLRALIAYGFPLMILGFLGAILVSIDRIMIAKYLGLEALGFYSIAILAANYIYSVPNAVGIVMIPNVQEAYGRSENAQDLKNTISKWSLVFSNTVPVLIALAWFLAPPLVSWILPGFEPGIPALKYLVLGGFFLAMVYPYSHFLIAIKRHLELLPLFVVALVLTILFNALAIRGGRGITGVAVATLLALFLKFTASYILASRYLVGFREALLGFGAVLLKFLYTFFLLHFLAVAGNGSEVLWQGMMRFIFFVVFFSPLLIQANAICDFASIFKRKAPGLRYG